MAEMSPQTIFALKLNDREFAVTMKAIGMASGLSIRPFTAEEKLIAKYLNETLLSNQVNVYRERLKQAEGKLSKAVVGQTVEPWTESESETT